MSKRFYITTAIDYVNGHPHLGHAYEKVIAEKAKREVRYMQNHLLFDHNIPVLSMAAGLTTSHAPTITTRSVRANCGFTSFISRIMP